MSAEQQQQQQQKDVLLLEIKILGHVLFRNIDFKIYYSDRHFSKLINDALMIIVEYDSELVLTRWLTWLLFCKHS